MTPVPALLTVNPHDEPAFRNDLVVPAQWDGFQQAWDTRGEMRLMLAVLAAAKDVLMREARRSTCPTFTGRGALAKVLNVIAWIEDEDGEAAMRAGCPYPWTFADVCRVIRMEPPAVARALRQRFRAWRHEAPGRTFRRVAA